MLFEYPTGMVSRYGLNMAVALLPTSRYVTPMFPDVADVAQILLTDIVMTPVTWSRSGSKIYI